MAAVAKNLPPNIEQIRELELLHREYEAQMLVTCDPEERRRLYGIKRLLETCITDMKKRLENS